MSPVTSLPRDNSLISLVHQQLLPRLPKDNSIISLAVGPPVFFHSRMPSENATRVLLSLGSQQDPEDLKRWADIGVSTSLSTEPHHPRINPPPPPPFFWDPFSLHLGRPLSDLQQLHVQRSQSKSELKLITRNDRGNGGS